MAQTTPSRPPRPTADLSRYHHEQGAQHHLNRIGKYVGGMQDATEEGRIPSMEHALQVSADLARYIAHLAALIEDDVLAQPADRKQPARIRPGRAA